MTATLTNPIHALLADVGGDVIATTETHTLAILDPESYVMAGPDPIGNPGWLAANLPAGIDWVTEWELDGDTSWVWITPAGSSAQ